MAINAQRRIKKSIKRKSLSTKRKNQRRGIEVRTKVGKGGHINQNEQKKVLLILKKKSLFAATTATAEQAREVATGTESRIDIGIAAGIGAAIVASEWIAETAVETETTRIDAWIAVRIETEITRIGAGIVETAVETEITRIGAGIVEIAVETETTRISTKILAGVVAEMIAMGTIE